MKLATLYLLIILGLSGCASGGEYRILKEEIMPKNTFVPFSEFSMQALRFPNEEIALDSSLVRWNTFYYLSIEIFNESKFEPLTVTPSKVSLYNPKDGTEIKAIKITVPSIERDFVSPEVVTLRGRQKITLLYVYNGAPLEFILSPIANDKHKILRLDLNGLSRKKNISIVLPYELYRRGL